VCSELWISCNSLLSMGENVRWNIGKTFSNAPTKDSTSWRRGSRRKVICGWSRPFGCSKENFYSLKACWYNTQDMKWRLDIRHLNSAYRVYKISIVKVVCLSSQSLSKTTLDWGKLNKTSFNILARLELKLYIEFFWGIFKM